MKLRRRRRVKAFPQKRSQLCVGVGFCPQLGGVGPYPAQCIWQGSGFAADQTNAMLAVARRRPPSPSPERTTNPSSRRKRQDSLSLSLVLFPPKPLRWVSAGALLGAVIKTPMLYFLHFCVGGITTLRPLCLCRNNSAQGLFQQKKRLSQSGCSVPTNALFPPAHSAFSAFLQGGGITTLGARFMLLKRWTPAGHGGLFAVFMPSRNLPRAG